MIFISFFRRRNTRIVHTDVLIIFMVKSNDYWPFYCALPKIKTKQQFSNFIRFYAKQNCNDMAAQLALQRNFLTIASNNSINTTTVLSNQTSTTLTTAATNGGIVTITAAGNQMTSTEPNTTPIQIMQTNTQVYFIVLHPIYYLNNNK